MIVDITNEVLTDIKTALRVIDVVVLSSYQPKVVKFPVVIVEELDNSAVIETKDSSGFQHSNIAFSIEIYTDGSKKMSKAKDIRDEVDVIMSGEYGMTRGRPMILPNYLDNTVYRYKLRYTGTIGKNKTIYRG